MADPINVTTENFDKAVLQSKGTAIVDLWASWCGPCRMLSPIIAQIANENPDIKVFKVNVDDEPDIATAYRRSRQSSFSRTVRKSTAPSAWFRRTSFLR